MSEKHQYLLIGVVLGALAYNFYVQQSTLGRIDQATGGLIFGR